MRFFLALACVLTFCIVCIGDSDAIIPFGYILMEGLKDDSTPLLIRVLLLVPFAATLVSPFVRHTFARTIATSFSMLLLFGLWLFGIFAYVVYPMPGNQIPNSVPAVTSIPFLLMVIATITHSLLVLRKARRQIVSPELAPDSGLA